MAISAKTLKKQLQIMKPVLAGYIPGFFAESVAVDGAAITVVAKDGAPEVDFAPVLAAGCTVELVEG
ncbi:MAG: hypothetical protein IIV81_02330, partial [Clostridia bacterium]|nr:hypothetical protein [Clostridia bacterium]